MAKPCLSTVHQSFAECCNAWMSVAKSCFVTAHRPSVYLPTTSIATGIIISGILAYWLLAISVARYIIPSGTVFFSTCSLIICWQVLWWVINNKAFLAKCLPIICQVLRHMAINGSLALQLLTNPTKLPALQQVQLPVKSTARPSLAVRVQHQSLPNKAKLNDSVVQICTKNDLYIKKAHGHTIKHNKNSAQLHLFGGPTNRRVRWWEHKQTQSFGSTRLPAAVRARKRLDCTRLSEMKRKNGPPRLPGFSEEPADMHERLLWQGENYACANSQMAGNLVLFQTRGRKLQF